VSRYYNEFLFSSTNMASAPGIRYLFAALIAFFLPVRATEAGEECKKVAYIPLRSLGV
jgi:hypothetical protein